MTFKLKLPHAADILAQRPLYVNAKELYWRTWIFMLCRSRFQTLIRKAFAYVERTEEVLAINELR